MRGRSSGSPRPPRCKLCTAPFEGVGGAVMRHFGFARLPANPAICQACVKSFRDQGLTGAEIPISLLFADVRGSTGIAEECGRPSSAPSWTVLPDRDGRDPEARRPGRQAGRRRGDRPVLRRRQRARPRGGGRRGGDRARAARIGRGDASPTGGIPIGAGVHTGEAYGGQRPDRSRRRLHGAGRRRQHDRPAWRPGGAGEILVTGRGSGCRRTRRTGSSGGTWRFVAATSPSMSW